MSDTIHESIVSFVNTHGGLTKYQLTKKLTDKFGTSHRAVNRIINDLVKNNILEFYSVSGNIFLRHSFSKPVYVTDRIVLIPGNSDINALNTGEDKTYIKLSGGIAFGDGSHPTTVLCLDYIDSFFSSISEDISKWKILDLGSGTGILSVACGLFGAGRIDLCDSDEAALYESKENITLNHVKAETRFFSDFNDTGFDYDLIVANLRYPSLIDFQKEIQRKIKKKGIIILSGIKQHEYDIIHNAFGVVFNEHKHHFKKNWCAIQYMN